MPNDEDYRFEDDFDDDEPFDDGNDESSEW